MLFINRTSVLLVLTSLFAIWQSTSLAQSSSDQTQANAELLANLSSVSDAMLQNPPSSDWLIWRRTYDSQGYSPLDQLNKQNVANLEQAWRTDLTTGTNMATPLSMTEYCSC